MKRLALTQHTVRCPLSDRPASLAVRTDPEGAPSRRHRAVAACSLRPSTSFVPPVRDRYFADVAPAVPYRGEVDSTPRQTADLSCSGKCLAVLNAAECGPVEPLRCTSAVSDSMELARRTQSPAVMRLLWLHSI